MIFEFPNQYNHLKTGEMIRNYRLRELPVSIDKMNEHVIQRKIAQFNDAFRQDRSIIEDSNWFTFLYEFILFTGNQAVPGMNSQPQLLNSQIQLLDTLQSQLYQLKDEQATNMTVFLILNLMNHPGLLGSEMKKALKSLTPMTQRKYPKTGQKYFFELIRLAHSIKDPLTRDLWTEFLVAAFSNFEIASDFKDSVYDQIQLENTAQNLSSLIIGLYNNDKTKSIASEMLSNILQTVTNLNLSENSIAAKNIKELLTITSKAIPKLYQQNICVYKKLYNHENYHLRNGLNEAITALIEYQNTINEESDTNQESLLKQLCTRYRDKTALTRSNLMQCISHLIGVGSINQSQIHMVLAIAFNRMKDVSGFPRKAAIQLVKEISRFYITNYCENGQGYFLQESEIAERNKECTYQMDGLKQDFRSIQSQINANEITQIQFDEEKAAIKAKLDKLLATKKFLDDYVDFVRFMEAVLHQTFELLESKTQGDVVQSIKLLSYLHKHRFPDSMHGVKKFILLIWNIDKQIQTEVTKKFFKLFMRQQKVDVIYGFVKDLSKKEFISLEKIIQSFKDEDQLSVIRSLFNKIWNQQLQAYDPCSIILTRLLINIENISFDQAEFLFALLKKQLLRPHTLITKEILSILSQIPYADNEELEELIGDSLEFLVGFVKYHYGKNNQFFYTLCDSIFLYFSAFPQNVCQDIYEEIINTMVRELSIDEEGKTYNKKLNHLIYVAGVISMKMMIFIDEYSKAIQVCKQDLEKLEFGNADDESHQQGAYDAPFETLQESIKQQQEQIIMDEGGLLNELVPFLVSQIEKHMDDVSSDQAQSELVQVSLLSLSKFMCVSEQFCQVCISVLFKLMKSDVDQIMKNNVIIALGDMLHKWPNTIQRFHSDIYVNLYDESAEVRKVTLQVLAHLILNDVIKSKACLQHIPQLLIDPNEQIQVMTRFFLSSMVKKEPKVISNSIQDIIKQLNQVQEELLSQIVLYIDKSLMEVCSEKVLALIAKSSKQTEIRNASYLLTQFPSSISCLEKIVDHWEFYREKGSNDPYVYEQYNNLVKKFRKGLTKKEYLHLVEDLERKVENVDEETFDRRRISSKRRRQQVEEAIQNQDQGQQEGDEQPKLKSALPIKRQKNKRAQLKQKSESEISDEEEELPRRQVQKKQKGKGGRKLKQFSNSDSSGSEFGMHLDSEEEVIVKKPARRNKQQLQ